MHGDASVMLVETADEAAHVPRVLVVDDDNDIRCLIVGKLERAGMEVIEAADGPSALLAAHANDLDLVVLDVLMPGLSGIEVCQQLRDDPATGKVPVMLLTALSHQRYVESGIDSGAAYYMSKPFSPAALVMRVRSLLEVETPAQEPATD